MSKDLILVIKECVFNQVKFVLYVLVLIPTLLRYSSMAKSLQEQIVTHYKEGAGLWETSTQSPLLHQNRASCLTFTNTLPVIQHKNKFALHR